MNTFIAPPTFLPFATWFLTVFLHPTFLSIITLKYTNALITYNNKYQTRRSYTSTKALTIILYMSFAVKMASTSINHNNVHNSPSITFPNPLTFIFFKNTINARTVYAFNNREHMIHFLLSRTPVSITYRSIHLLPYMLYFYLL